MPHFTSTKHGNLATDLTKYWLKQNERETKAKQWFMAALAIGCALEALLYGYFIIWGGDADPSKDEQIPDNLVLNDLLDAARQIDILTPIKFKDKFGAHAVQNVVNEIRHMRNNIHAGVALRKNFNPAKFRKKDYLRIERIFAVVMDNWERNL